MDPHSHSSPHMSHYPKRLKGGCIGAFCETMLGLLGIIKGDAGSLDYGSYELRTSVGLGGPIGGGI